MTAVLAMAIMLQCYATRGDARCLPFSVHETLAECRALARDYQRFDSRALRLTSVPMVVSYRCMQQKA